MCKSCGSDNQSKFTAEVAIQLLACLDCGVADFVIPETELGMLAIFKASAAENV